MGGWSSVERQVPRLLTISQCKDSMVGDIIDRVKIRSEGCQIWKLGWCRERFEWEKQLEEQLLNMISKVQWNMEGQDRPVWVGDDKYEYTIKSGYSILNNEDLMHSSKVF